MTARGRTIVAGLAGPRLEEKPRFSRDGCRPASTVAMLTAPAGATSAGPTGRGGRGRRVPCSMSDCRGTGQLGVRAAAINTAMAGFRGGGRGGGVEIMVEKRSGGER